MDEKKKNPEEELKDEKKPESAEEQQDNPVTEKQPKDTKPEEKSEEKPTDEKQADENGEGADKPDEQKDEPKSEDEEKAVESVPDVPQLSEEEKLKAENLTLKTQLEAMKIGFAPDCMEDAVILAEAIVKRDGTDISAALQSVAKKYPDWKADSKDNKDGKSKGGFKFGADISDENKKADDEKLNNAFGIKKKKC